MDNNPKDMVNAPAALAAVGDTVNLTIEAIVEDVPTSLKLTASLCHNNKSKTEESYFIGMVFKNLSQLDRLVLHYPSKTPQA